MVVIVVVLVAAVGPVLLVARRRRRRAERHRAALEAALGSTIELIAVVLGSGGTIRQAVGAVAVDGPEAVRPAFGGVVHRADRGQLLVDALSAASDDLGPAYHHLLGALLAAESDGAPVGSLLTTLADEVETGERWRAEAAAGRLSVALLPPLVLCLLPAVVLGAIVPLVVVALRPLAP